MHIKADEKKWAGGTTTDFLQSYAFCTKYDREILLYIKAEMLNTGEGTNVGKKKINKPSS